MSELQELFIRYQQEPITPECYKELGKLIKQSSPLEIQTALDSIQPNELHLQLFKLTAARIANYYHPLLEGLKNECRFVTEYCINSKILFKTSGAGLLNVDFLLLLLDVASLRTRYCVLSNLGKYLSLEKDTNITVADVDVLYNAVTRVWGPKMARPLLCQTSKALLETELTHVSFLSKRHLNVIAKRFPYLALSWLESYSSNRVPEDVAHYIIRNTMPKSLAYLQKGGCSFLSKSTMKIVLRNHLNVVLEDPSNWINILEPKLVKKLVKPEDVAIFLTKAWANQDYFYGTALSFVNILHSNEVSKILNEVMRIKYGSSVRDKLSFWESNTELLKHLDPSDRTYIAEELYKKHSSNEWLHFMTTDKSVPLIKKMLYIEQNSRERAQLVGKLVETAVLNSDQNVLVDVSNLIVTRYRNDTDTLSEFLSSSIDFSSLPTETWNSIYTMAKKCFTSECWWTRSPSNILFTAIKRDGEPALKEYLELVMGNKYSYCLHPSNIEDLQCELQSVCIREIFIAENIGNKEKRSRLTDFFHVITKWSSNSSVSLIDSNVTECVLTNLRKDEHIFLTMQFVIDNIKTLTVEFIENCFKLQLNPVLLCYLFSKLSPLATSEETCKRIFDKISLWGVGDYVKILIKLKKLGYSKALQSFASHSKTILDDPNNNECKNAIMLLMLTVHTNEFFSIIDPLLSSGNSKSSNVTGDNEQALDYHPLKSSEKIESIYCGIGLSLSRVELPIMAVDRLSKFCVSGDLIIFVRGALYSICRYLPHEAAKKLLFSLIEQPVSVKKHGIRLMQLVCNIETQREMFDKLFHSEKHMSIRIILMHNVLICLDDTKSESFWDITRKILLEITPDDKVMVTELVKKSVPDQFLEQYWTILIEKIQLLNAVKHNDILSSVFRKVECNVQKLSANFIETMITTFFLSDRFFDDQSPHNWIDNIVIHYLKGTALIESMDQCIAEHDGNLAHCQLFMKGKLSTSGIGSSNDIFVPVTGNGMYPVRSLLMSFIQRFCTCCLETDFKVPSTKSLHDYIDFFINYFEQFNQNAVFFPVIFLSMTKILILNKESHFVTGQKIGEFCDEMALNDTNVLCYFNFPNAADDFFNAMYFCLKLSEERHELLDILRGILDSTPSSGGIGSHQEICRMLRLMTVAHILSSRTEDVYKEFKMTFFPLIKDTPVEVYLINMR